MTQKKQVKKSSMKAGKVLAIGVGVGALGAGAYYLLGPDGKKNQKKAKEWMTKMKNEVEKEVSKAKDVTESMYHNKVDALVSNYSKQYKEHSPEIKAFAQQLKGGWKKVEKKSKPVIKQTKKIVKKTINTAKKQTQKK